MNCPKCASEEWKLASVIYLNGKSKTSSTILGIGTSADVLSDGGGIGIGGGITNGVQQTEISNLAAPPIKVMRPAKAVAIFGGCIFLIGIIFFGNVSFENNPFLTKFLFVFSPGLTAIGCFRMLFTSEITKEINENHKKTLAEYEKKRMCLRCGTFYFSLNDKESCSSSSTKKCPFCAESIRSEAIRCKHCSSNI